MLRIVLVVALSILTVSSILWVLVLHRWRPVSPILSLVLHLVLVLRVLHRRSVSLGLFCLLMRLWWLLWLRRLLGLLRLGRPGRRLRVLLRLLPVVGIRLLVSRVAPVSLLHMLLSIHVARGCRAVLLEGVEGLLLTRACWLTVPRRGLGLCIRSLLAVERRPEPRSKVVSSSKSKVSKLEVQPNPFGSGAAWLLSPLCALSNVTLPSTWLGLLRDTVLC